MVVMEVISENIKNTILNDDQKHEEVVSKDSQKHDVPKDSQEEHVVSRDENNEPIGCDQMAGKQGGHDKRLEKKSGMLGLMGTESLRELLILQLGLIELQQNKIQDKDKQIISLRSEKEQLEARLRRMERRLAIQKSKNNDGDGTPVTKKPLFPAASTVSKPSHTKPVVQPTSFVNVSSKGHKLKYFSSLLTDNEYLDPPSSKIHTHLLPTDEKNEEEAMEKIAVPSWHEVVKTDDYLTSPHVEEDVSDKAYAKRHSKPEAEELKRKRWDAQATRQQRQHALLAQKYDRRQNKDDVKTPSKSLNTLYREPDHAMMIDITGVLPVCVFGNHVPYFKKSEMNLPWFSIQKREVQMREAKERQNRTKIKKRKSFV